MVASPAPPHALHLPAPPEDLCLRFANTLSWRGSAQPHDSLLAPSDLLRFAVAECGVPAAVAERFTDSGDETGFAAALRLREAIYRLFAARSAGEAGAAGDLAALNDALAAAPDRARIALSAADCGWVVPALKSGIPLLLAPVAWSAGDLLLGPRAARVRQCANPACQWLFLDDSKSGNRRWCSMSACGNRAKAHRHYLKQKQARG